jgi:hypothetical protein
MPPVDRPTCPYEQIEYNSTLTDALGRAATNSDSDPLLLHIAHNTALLQVMMTRASLALRNAPLIDTVLATRDASDHAGAYQMQSTKPSAHLQAFMRIAAEYRHFADMLTHPKYTKIPVAEHLNRTTRTLADTDLDPDRQDLLHPDAFAGMNQTQRYISDAIEKAFAGDSARARQSFQSARDLATSCTPPYENPVNGATYPEVHRLSEGTVKALLNHMNKTHPPSKGKT